MINGHFGLLSHKSADLLSDSLWNIAFYLHIFSGGLALLLGWTHLVSRWRSNRPGVHRSIGKLYFLLVLISGTSGLGIALAATGGWSCQLAFMASALLWLISTALAYVAIRKGDVIRHRRMMIYSYA